jgi:hypothetical protein
MARTLELELELVGVTPRIWRRVRVAADMALADLHHAIQVLMGWEDYHLHVFEIAGREYGPRPEEDWEREQWAADDATVSVARAMGLAGGPFEYHYDFGDDWRVAIAVVGEAPPLAKGIVECVAGDRAGPPEDIGGPHRYQEVIDAWGPRGRASLPAELAEGLPKGFDPGRFSVEAANIGLRDAFREKATPEFPAGPGAPPGAHLLARLSLVVLYLGSSATRQGARQAWKTIRFEVLDSLQEAGLVYSDPRRKSVVITEAGIAYAAMLLEQLTPLMTPPEKPQG